MSGCGAPTAPMTSGAQLGVVPVVAATPTLSKVTTRRAAASASTSAGSQLSRRSTAPDGVGNDTSAPHTAGSIRSQPA